MSYLKAVVPRPPKNVLPRRMPVALREENFLTVMTACVASPPNHVSPAPSAPAGQRMFVTLLKSLSEDDGPAVICASCSGMGTRDERLVIGARECFGHVDLGFRNRMLMVSCPTDRNIEDPRPRHLCHLPEIFCGRLCDTSTAHHTGCASIIVARSPACSQKRTSLFSCSPPLTTQT